MGRNIVLRGPGTDVTMRKTEVLDVEKKSPREILEETYRRMDNGEELTEEEKLQGLLAMIDQWYPERKSTPENTEAE